ncbi:MAG: hypothetical protein P1V51_09465 [Deltaproteobacteria bacterium]|nr:hypothetical protein [Deltaproteobacteria bacterium]
MRSKLIVIALALTFAAPAAAQNSPPPARRQAELPNLGKIRKNRYIGVGLGTGTLASGFSAKYIVGDALAFQANLGGCHRCVRRTNGYWYYGAYNGIAASIDVLLEMPGVRRNEIVRFGWYLGAGGGLGIDEFGSSLGLAVAGVIGGSLEFVPIPIDLALEYRPNVRIFLGGAAAGFDFGLVTAHIRFYIL